MTSLPEVLFVSKPMGSPWNDSSKNLARDIASHLQRHAPVLLGRRGQGAVIDRGRLEPVYGMSTEGGFSPSWRANARVFQRLVFGPRLDLWHFFFSPSSKSSAAARLARAIRKVPSVHTVCSMPQEPIASRLVFADLTVVLSRASFDCFEAAGVPATGLRLIPPCVPSMKALSALERNEARRALGFAEGASIWIFPGDLEHGGGAELALEALAAWNRPDTLLLMACRSKTARAPLAKARLRALAQAWGIESQVRWVGETSRMQALLAASDFVVMVNPSPYAKMDYPLVVLEAMALGRPVLVAEGTPSAELAQEAAALAVPADGQALADAIEELDRDEARRQSLERTAHALSVSRFSPATVAARYELLYEELRA